jgi:CBS domain-containing protein
VYEFLGYQVQDVMSSPVSVPPEASLAEAERVLEAHGFNALPVVTRDGLLVGVVTSLDLLKAFRFTAESILPPYDEIMRRTVESVMTREPVTVRPRTPLTRVLEKLVATRDKSFPVVDEDHRLVGMVAREDVMRALRRADAGERPPAGAAGPARPGKPGA